MNNETTLNENASSQQKKLLRKLEENLQMGKKVANHIYDKGLISKIYKEFI